MKNFKINLCTMANTLRGSHKVMEFTLGQMERFMKGNGWMELKVDLAFGEDQAEILI